MSTFFSSRSKSYWSRKGGEKERRREIGFEAIAEEKETDLSRLPFAIFLNVNICQGGKKVRIYNPTGPQVNAKVPDLWMSNVAVLNNSDHHTRKEER